MIKVKKINKVEYSKDILNLRNKDFVRNNSLNKKKLCFDDHEAWFKKYVKINKFYIILEYEKFVGYIRIEKKTRNVSWALKKKYHGKINFYKILKKVAKNNQYAIIKKNNISSIIVALKANFKIISLKNNYFKLKKY